MIVTMRPRLLIAAVAIACAAGLVAAWPSPDPQLAVANPLAEIATVAAGGGHTCALTTAGAVKCWGDNVYGQLGDGTSTQRAKPVDVSGLSGEAIAVVTGGLHTCALTTAGGVKCWGWNRYGQLGNGSITGFLPNPNPSDVIDLDGDVAALAAGGVHTCALTTAGGVKCWGWNRYGQLGDGQACGTVCAHPVDVAGLTSGVAAVAAGGNHTCALTTTGGVKCWGENAASQLGTTSGSPCTNPVLEPIPCSTTPIDVSELASGVAAITAGGQHTCALTAAGGVTCWGDNASGQLGDGTTTSRTTPADVSGLAGGVATVAAGGLHTCVLTTDGSAKCWGDDGFGQLGNGEKAEDQLTPVDVCANEGCPLACVTKPCETVLVASNIALGTNHSCALAPSGGLKCWGDNALGQLGDNQSCGTSCEKPVEVQGVKGPAEQPGDANCDGTANSIDAALILQYGAGLLSTLRCQGAADVNGDRRIDAIDAALILQYVAGLLPGL